LDEWYRTLETPILVSQEFKIPIDGGYSITSEDWTAFATSIPVSFLHDAFQQHKDKLFSANVRAYLGSRKSDSNINNGIKKTTEDEPNNFWVFNNGITGLVHEFQEETSNGKKFLKIKGLSIVNGAQTTGATGSLLSSPDPKAKVQARFVRCSKRDTIQKIVEYNNRQNKVEASDFRSNDAIQRRLVQEFEHITEANYLGGRRGGYEDPIRRTSNLLPSDTVGQALAAVHQDPVLAYNSKSEIWISDTLYSRYFNEQTSADHIVFVFSLLRSVEAKKHELVMKDTSALTDIETKQLRFLRYRGATFILTTAIAKCIDIFLNRAVPNLFRVSFSKNISPQMGQLSWDPIVNVAISFCDQLVPAVKDGLKSSDEASRVINTFQSLVEAIKTPNVTTFESFASQVKVHSGEITS
jgi:AIPR protein